MMGRFLLDAMFVLIIIMIGSLLITNDEKSVDINDELQNFDALIVNGNVVEDGYLENADKVIYDDFIIDAIDEPHYVKFLTKFNKAVNLVLDIANDSKIPVRRNDLPWQKGRFPDHFPQTG